MDTQSSDELPIGAIVENSKPAPIPTKKKYAGEFVKLHTVDPESDVDELFLNSHGSDEKERIWTGWHMSLILYTGPFIIHGRM